MRGDDQAAFPKIRVVTVSECGSHAPVLAVMGPAAGGKGSGEQSLARKLYPRLDEDWLVIADRNFYNWKDWGTAAGTGAALLWRMKENARLPVLEMLPDHLPRDVPDRAEDHRQETGRADRRGPARRGTGGRTGAEAGAGDRVRRPRPGKATAPDELIVLVTTITDFRAATAQALAGAYHERWEHETGNAQLKTYLRGPGRVLRSGSPDLIEQEIFRARVPAGVGAQGRGPGDRGRGR